MHIERNYIFKIRYRARRDPNEAKRQLTLKRKKILYATTAQHAHTNTQTPKE